MRFLILTIILTVPVIAFGQYSPLVDIVGDGDSAGFSNYIQTLYFWSIGIAALLAVVKIMIAGVKYMMTDNVSSKGSALSDIKGALFGLLLIAAAVLILTTINPKLVETSISLKPAKEVEVINTNPGLAPTIEDNLEEDADTTVETYTPTGECNVRTDLSDEDYYKVVLDVSGCPEGDRAAYIGNFNLYYCTSIEGIKDVALSNEGTHVVCEGVKLTSIKAYNGSILQNAEEIIVEAFDFSAAESQCLEKATYDGTYVFDPEDHLEVEAMGDFQYKCILPKVIKYTGDEEDLYEEQCDYFGGYFNDNSGSSGEAFGYFCEIYE